MFLIIGDIGQVSTSSTLVRKVKWKLLLLSPEQLCESSITLGSDKQVSRVSKIGCFYVVFSACIKLGDHNCAGACVSVDFDSFNEDLTEFLGVISLKNGFDISHELFAEKPRVNSLFDPATYAIGHDQELVWCKPSIFSSLVLLADMWDVGCCISEASVTGRAVFLGLDDCLMLFLQEGLRMLSVCELHDSTKSKNSSSDNCSVFPHIFS